MMTSKWCRSAFTNNTILTKFYYRPSPNVRPKNSFHIQRVQGLGHGHGSALQTIKTGSYICEYQSCRAIFTLGLSNSNRYNKYSWDETQGKKQTSWNVYCAQLGLALVTGGILVYYKTNADCQQREKDNSVAGMFRKDLPNYKLEEIEQHKNKETGMWVTYKDGVYDMTKFVQYHPGGPKVLLAAGGSLEPFWELYAVHKEENVLEMLEKMRIGNVDPEDLKKQKAAKTDVTDPFVNDPKRHPALHINSSKPFNAEPPPELLIDNFMTPNELFFVRNHLPVPVVDIKNYKLEISGEGLRKPVTLSINDLKRKFKVHTITAVIQCAGNRRKEMSAVKQVKGLTWGNSALGNATWTGVKLSDVLAYAGVKDEYIAHVQFEGLDKDVTGTPYGASIPVETAMDPKKEVLLAFAMNGKDLPVDHGCPLRVVIPGTAGARHVKWLSKIVASKEESRSHWQRNDYKTFNPSVDWDTVDFSKAPAIQELPVQSAICDPLPDSTVADSGEITVRGYAWSGGGHGIARVDVSVDGGKTWTSAELHQEPQKYYRQWAWTQWEAHIEIPKENKGKLEIVCKAVDTANNTQPRDVEGIWNVRGLSNNSWHHVNVSLSPDHDD